MDMLPAQLKYSLRRGEAEVVIAIEKLLERLRRVTLTDDALITEWEDTTNWNSGSSSNVQKRQATSDGQPWQRADAV
jgi:hypothetical protein